MTDAAAPTSERYRLWHGRDEPPVERRKLRAGLVECELEGVDLRYVRAGDVELVRRLYVAVRDRNWGTLPIEIGELEVDDRGDSFRLTFDARHRQHEIDFRWRGELNGGADGSIDYSLEGVAETEFLYNRIGFCILHPAENAGCPYRARTPDGRVGDRLPDTIGPQLWEGGFPRPIFPSFDELELEVARDVVARFQLEGDLFEMEDQRNWTDASFKTYSTPLQLGYPHRAEPGQRIQQRVRLTIEGARRRPRDADAPVRLELREAAGRLPLYGLGQSSHGGRLYEREVELLRALRLDHLRIELKLTEDWRAELERGVETAAALECELELAVFLADDPEEPLKELAAALKGVDTPLARVLVFREGEHSTGGESVGLARALLGGAVGGAPFAGGSNALFTEVNRTRPDVDAVDGVVYALNATVHATDDTSVMETPGVHGETVHSARAFSEDLPIHVGPITFNQRYNPVATGPEPEPEPGELPVQVDPRQCSLFGAAWTLASAKSLAEAGPASVTYFETTGWRGVLETEQGSPVPERFHSRPGATFPLYHVLADLGEAKSAEVAPARSSRPLAVEALALRRDGALTVLVANLSPEPQRCLLAPLPDGEVTLRVLDEETAVEAGDDPQAFRNQGEPVTVSGGQLELALLPYAVARVQT